MIYSHFGHFLGPNFGPGAKMAFFGPKKCPKMAENQNFQNRPLAKLDITPINKIAKFQPILITQC